MQPARRVPPAPAAHRCATAPAPRASASPAKAPPKPRQGPAKGGSYARLRRAGFAPYGRRFWALRAPIVRPSGAQCSRLRREMVRKTPAVSARAFRGWRVYSLNKSNSCSRKHSARLNHPLFMHIRKSSASVFPFCLLLLMANIFLSGGLKNGLQTPPKCPQIGF